MAEGTLVSTDVRRHNMAVILEHIARDGPSARSEIARATGLSRGAVTALTTALTDAGVLAELTPELPSRGRPLTRLRLAGDGVAIVAVQLNADEATVLVTDLAGTELFREARHHGRPMGRPEPVLDVLAEVLGSGLAAVAREGRRVGDLTVVIFAPIGGTPPRVLADTDLGWGEVDVLAALRARITGLPEQITLSSDAPVAASAELTRLGAVSDAVYIKSDSGIGGAIVTGGVMLAGAHGVGASLGHLPIVADGPTCECGQRGCLVTVAGPDVVLRNAGLGAALAHDGLTAALREFLRRIDAADARATGAWHDALPHIARTLQIVAMAVDPELVIIGGYWASLAPSIASAFEANQARVFGVPGARPPAVVPSTLGPDAALLGALWSARSRLLADPLELV